MIDESDYKLPRKQEQTRQQTPEEEARAAETLAWLEALPWRPFGVEW